MKTSTPKHGGVFALTLVTVAIPLTVLGALVTSAASSDSDSNPRSLQYEFFDLRSFRLQQRSNHTYEPAPSSVTVHPAAADQFLHAASGSGALKYSDLSASERETLRLQLRIGGCPQDALPGYRMLCEKMLKARPHPAVREGLKSPGR